MEITSTNNDLVKDTVKLQQKKYRTKSGKFILEGYKAIKEAFDSGIKLEYIFASEKHFEDYNFAKDILIKTTENVLKKLATTDSAPSALAIGYQKQYDINILKNKKKVILLENIKDLGNLGTIIRSSVAFGAEAIVLYGGETVDIYNPKCVRATVGNLWKISEADGLSDDLIKFSTSSVKIEMNKTVESLNLASSVSIILYELFIEG